MVKVGSEIEEVLKQIESQKGDSADDEVYVIEIMSIRFKSFSQQIKNSLERFSSLQMLTINDCGLDDLSNFPHLPSLIRLDLVFNSITGEDLQYLRGSRHLQTLMLGANSIRDVNDIRRLGQMRELFQIDILNNPAAATDGYSKAIFNFFPSLHIVDTLDRNGVDPAKANLDISASRIPQNLFDTSKPVASTSSSSSTNLFASKAKAATTTATSVVKKVVAPKVQQPVKKAPAAAAAAAQSSVVKKAPAAAAAQSSVAKKAIVTAAKAKHANPAVAASLASGPRKSPALRNAKSAAALSNRFTVSERSGLVFPCGRIRRLFKQTTLNQFRQSKYSPIFISAVLEYLAAEVLELAGNQAKSHKLSRITPNHVREVFMQDEELNKLVSGTILSDAGHTRSQSQLNMNTKSK